MAVRSSAASESAGTGPAGPIRTCIGCRRRAAAAELLRVVVAPDATGTAGVPAPAEPGVVPVVPDPRHRAQGRGAWLHIDPVCVEQALRRRAFARALRVSGALDPTPVREYVAGATNRQDLPAGTRQEMKSNGHSMKRQR